MNVVIKAAAVVTAIGTIGGGTMYLNEIHYPMARGMAMEASGHVTAIQNWIRVAREEGVSGYICDAIEAELIALCTEMPEHYLCTDQARRDTLKRAGCE